MPSLTKLPLVCGTQSTNRFATNLLYLTGTLISFVGQQVIHQVLTDIADRRYLPAIARRHPAHLISQKYMNHLVSAIVVLPVDTFPQPANRRNQFWLLRQGFHFSLANMMLLVMSVSGGIGILTTFPNSTAAIWFYILVVSGVLSFIQAPRSWDVWLPTGMNVLLITLVPSGPPTTESLRDFINFGRDPSFFHYSLLCALVCVPFLIDSVRRRRARDERSFAILVYQFITAFPGLVAIAAFLIVVFLTAMMDLGPPSSFPRI